MDIHFGDRPLKRNLWVMMFLLITLGLALAACSPAGVNGKSSSSSQSKSQPTPFQPAGKQSNGSQENGSELPASSEAPVAQPEGLADGPGSVVITSLADNSVVNTGVIEIKGQANPGTVISINDEIASVGKDRTFHVSVTLEEGLNVLEITTSDLQGDQGTAYLTVTYEPQK